MTSTDMQNIIITDFTRFADPKIACTAGIDLTTGQCVRPMPYLKVALCQSLKILPGTIISGEFTPDHHLTGPHQEDMSYKKLAYMGVCNSSDFKLALHAGLFDTVEKGFHIELALNQKHIPLGHTIRRSVITVKIQPNKIDIVEGVYNQKTIKLNFTDNSGRAFKYMPIYDLGFHGYAEKLHMSNGLNTLKAFICSQSEVYLRLGLSRPWDNGKINGYWMQVNGLYTFPDYHHEMRSIQMAKP